MPRYLISVSKTFALALALLSLFGCVAPKTTGPASTNPAVEAERFKQKCLTVQEGVAFRQRLEDISFRLGCGARELTTKRRYSAGFILTRRSFATKEYEPVIAEVFGLGSGPRIIRVTAGSPEDPKKWSQYLKDHELDRSTRFDIARDGEKMTVEVARVDTASCAIKVHQSSDIAAFTINQVIYVTKGLMRFAANDDELAVVISHELAHVIQDQNAAGPTKAQNRIGLGNHASVKEKEAEADYVGLYIMAAAGYDFHAAPNFVRRMATVHPGNIEAKYAQSHPTSPERFVMLEETIKEIDSKKERGLPLVPDPNSRIWKKR